MQVSRGTQRLFSGEPGERKGLRAVTGEPRHLERGRGAAAVRTAYGVGLIAV